jgi:endothelin-converting enzyme
MSTARASTDDGQYRLLPGEAPKLISISVDLITSLEIAPLLDPTSEARPASEEEEQGLYPYRSRALTGIEKLLAILALLFLLLAAVFIGLFAGTASQLKKARHQPTPTQTHTVDRPHATTTVTATTTVGHPTPTDKPDTKNQTCLSRECILLASEILQNIDDSIDPCEDFYMYASMLIPISDSNPIRH